MIGSFRKLLGRNYYPLNKIEVNQKRLIENYNYLSDLSKKVKIAPVVKSNAYGHGIEQVAKILDRLKPPFFCVDSLFEAYQLKSAGVKSPILIMGFVDSRNLKAKKLPFSFTVFDLEFAKALNRHQPSAKIHIKVDTGMNRIGVQIDKLPGFLVQIKKLKNLNVEGVMSHFSSPRTSKSYTRLQLDNFKKSIKVFAANGINPKWSHIAASGAIFNVNLKKLEEVSNLARCGITIYGASAEGKTKPVLELKSQIVQIKKLPKGAQVGYDRTYRTSAETTIGILPIGYNDGVERRLSNIGFVSYKKNTCPIIGRVSMNITTIDITGIKKPKVGDEVTIISAKPKEPNNIRGLAQAVGTIPHEMLVHLHAKSIRRIVV